jgi:PAS domain S-box-containing protein
MLIEMRQASDRPEAIYSLDALIELLSHDDRPTFILDSHGEEIHTDSKYHVTFLNRSLKELVDDRYKEQSDDAIFRCWTKEIEGLEKGSFQPYIDWEKDGLTWRTTALGTRWKVTHLRHVKLGTDESTMPWKHISGRRSDRSVSPPSVQPTPDDICATTSSNPRTADTIQPSHSRPSTEGEENPHGRKRKRSPIVPSPNLSGPIQDDSNVPSSSLGAAKKPPSQVDEAERTGSMFKELVDCATVGCAIFHPDGRPIFLNDAYLKLTGLSRERFRPGEWQQAIVPEDLSIVEERWGQLAAGKKLEPFAFRVKRSSQIGLHKDGSETMEYRWVQSNGLGHLNPDGSCRMVMGWLTDISHQKWSEHLQAKRLEDALENKRQTEKFIDMVRCSDRVS